MRRLRTKLMLSLLVVTLIPMVPSYHLARALVDRTFELIFNDTVESAIQGANRLSQQLYARHREETRALAEPLASSPHVRALLAGGADAASEAGLREAAAVLGEYALDVYDNARTRVVSIRALPDSLLADSLLADSLLASPLLADDTEREADDHVDISLRFAGGEEAEDAGGLGAQIAQEVFALVGRPDHGIPIETQADQLEEWASRTTPYVLSSGGDPSYVSLYLPVFDGERRLGSVLLSRRMPEGFPENARQVMAVNQVFQAAGYVKDEARVLFIGLFVSFYVVLAALAVGVGYIFSRRLTSPLMRLVDGTRVVAGGNLDYSIEVKSRDEIGQLMESFNQMIAAIKENQLLAREREQERLKVAAESAQHEADLEVSRLRTRALQAENEAKDLELKRGQELERAYQELEESHRQLQEAQAQLILQEKMASLGTMVAGFAHEINNPMGAVHSAADVAHRCVVRLEGVLESGGSGSPELDAECARTLDILRSNLQVIDDGEERITRLVESLRNFARLDEAELLVADLHEGLDSSLNLIGQELATRIQVRREYGEIPETFCAASQINQVFLNVLRNAVQAIEAEGEIRIRTSLQDGRIAVRISDTGPGIEPEQLERIFDLHFSSNASRVKLGSGLSMAYRIVQEHDGDLRIDSTPGEGTEVVILLPVRKAGEA